MFACQHSSSFFFSALLYFLSLGTIFFCPRSYFAQVCGLPHGLSAEPVDKTNDNDVFLGFNSVFV